MGWGVPYPSAPLETTTDEICDCSKHGAYESMDPCAFGDSYAACGKWCCEDCALRCDLCSYKYCPDHAIIVERENGPDDVICRECLERIQQAAAQAAA